MFKIEKKTYNIDLKQYINNYRDVNKFLEYCKQCPKYDKFWVCPPFDFDTAAFLSKYTHATIIGHKVRLLKNCELLCYFRDSGLVTYVSTLLSPSLLMPCTSSIFQHPLQLLELKKFCNNGLKMVITDKKEQNEILSKIYSDARKLSDINILRLEAKTPNSKAFYAGSCVICSICSKSEGGECKYPETAKFSLEALGFDIEKTAIELFNTELKWSSDDKFPEYLFLVSAVLR